MVIGAFQIHLHLPMSHSLKEKRGYIKGMVQKLIRKYNVSMAEIDNLDDWQYATLGMVMVSNNKTIIENTFQKVLDDIELANGIELETYLEEYL
jgi:uncharacterized protein YlxP (DUF503 family)